MSIEFASGRRTRKTLVCPWSWDYRKGRIDESDAEGNGCRKRQYGDARGTSGISTLKDSLPHQGYESTPRRDAVKALSKET